MSIYRPLRSENGREERDEGPKLVPLEEWLDDLMAEREVVMLRLRQLDRVLVMYRRLKVETLPKRIR